MPRRQRHRATRAQSMVEFALVAPLVTYVLLWGFAALIFAIQHGSAAGAARTGLRAATAAPSGPQPDVAAIDAAVTPALDAGIGHPAIHHLALNQPCPSASAVPIGELDICASASGSGPVFVVVRVVGRPVHVVPMTPVFEVDETAAGYSTGFTR